MILVFFRPFRRAQSRNKACIFVLISTLLLGTSCSDGTDGTRPANESSKPRVALVMKSLANEFFQTMQEGAVAHQAGSGGTYELISNGIKDEQDVTRQAQLVEQMIAQQVDAIVIAPADSKALVSVCQRAMEAGIVVVNIDNRFDEAVLQDKGLEIPFVGPNNRKGARLAGEHLAQQLEKGDQVAILEGVPGAINGIQRKLGFEDAMKAAEMAIVSSQSAHWETDQANRLVAALLTEHPSLKAILACNDSMALGAVAALKSAGKEETIKVIGFDNISAVQALMRDGRVLCSVDQHGDQLAAFGIEYALEILETNELPGDRETPGDLVTPKTLP